MDRLRAFEVFTTVVARAGFARAAEALDTSPANVTRYVADLEAYLGTRLINRTSRRLSLTDDGERLYERLKLVLEDIADAENAASSAAVRPRGRLRINAPLSFGILHLAGLWPSFMALHPEVELEVDLTDRVVDLVEEGFDLAIRISRGGSQSHIARKLASSRNVLCASPDYIARHGAPRHPADLAAHRAVVYSYAVNPDEWALIDGDGKAHLVRPGAVMSTNNGDTARAAALAGAAIIWQPTFLIGEDLRAGRLLRLMPDYTMPDIDVLAVYPSRKHMSAKVRAMVDFLVQAFSYGALWDQ